LLPLLRKLAGSDSLRVICGVVCLLDKAALRQANITFMKFPTRSRQAEHV
jgi:hypothetical protein